MQIRHDSVDRDLQWMERSPVVVEHGKRLAEILVSLVRQSIHKVGLYEYAVELNRLRVERAHVALVQGTKSVVCFIDRLRPLLLTHGNLAQLQQPLYIIEPADCLLEDALHVACLDCLLHSSLSQVFLRPLRDDPVGHSFHGEASCLWLEVDLDVRVLRLSEWLRVVSVEEMLVAQLKWLLSSSVDLCSESADVRERVA